MRADASKLVTAYLNELTQRAPRSILETFVEPRVQAHGGQAVRGVVESLHADTPALLQGDLGAGKTTAIRVVVHQLAHAYMDSRFAVCPVLVFASTLPPPGDDPWNWLATAAAQLTESNENTVDVLAATLKAGRAHLFVDGLDEIRDAGQRFRVAETLAALQGESPDLKLCVSTRALDVESAVLRDRFAVWSILPFDGSQAQQLLSVLTASRGLDVEYQLANAPQLGSLTSSPPMLHLLAFYSGSRGFELPRSRIQLFEDLTDALLARERQKVTQPVPTEVVHRVHELIAEAMAREGTGSLLLSRLDDALAHDRHGILAAKDRSLALRYATDRVVLLVQNTSTTVAFDHRSFQEFYLGRALARDISIIDSIPPGDLTEALSFAAGLAADPLPVIKVAYRRHGVSLAARCCSDLRQDQQAARHSLVELLLEDLGEEFSQPLSDALQGRLASPEGQDNSRQDELFGHLSQLWTELPKKGATADARGRGLEWFAVKLFGAYFEIADVRRRHQVGEVDVVCENVIADPFWANYGGDIWVECKNTEAKATIEQVNTFIGKLVGSRWKLGFFLSVSGFTKDAMNRLKNVGNNPGIPLIVPISGDDVEELLLHRTELQRFFKARIRRVA